MANFANRTAGLNSLAVSRLGGEDWELDGIAVTAIYDARYKKVNFGDERYKNVDMTGVGIQSTGPALTIPTADLPEGFGRKSEAYRVSDESIFVVASVEHDNGMTVVRLTREA